MTFTGMVVLLCRFLEDELARRYRDAAPGTLALLQVMGSAPAGQHVCAC